MMQSKMMMPAIKHMRIFISWATVSVWPYTL